MALTWQWSNKIGELTIQENIHEGEEGKVFNISLYQGNAFLIMLHEYENEGKEFYSVYGFFDDERHMKACLGLEKKSDGNIYDGMWKKLRINKAKYSYTEKLVSAVVKAFDNITIEVYHEE